MKTVTATPIFRARLALIGRALLVGTALHTAGYAQMTNDGSGGASTASDEIIVTALKRNSSVQDTPATVNVVQGERLAEMNITSGLDLASVTPGLVVQVAPGGQPIAVVRGIGTSPQSQSFDQSVAVFFDGVFLAHGRDLTTPLFDVADIQLIKGGQSAILGKNTTVGALSISTRKPTSNFGYSFAYTHEFERGSDTLEGAVNIPLGDTLALRLAGRFDDLEGWAKNELTGRSSPRIKSYAGRASLRWTPTDSLDWTFTYQHDDYATRGQILYVASDPLGRVAAIAAAAGDPNFTATFNDRYRSSQRAGLPEDFIKVRSNRVYSTVDFDIGKDYKLTSITSYYKSNGSWLTNQLPVINSPLNYYSPAAPDRTVSQEIRLTSPRVGAFEFLIGGLYFRNIYAVQNGWDGVAPSPLTGNHITFFKQKTRDWSGFASGTLYVTDSLKAIGAARYTTERRRAQYSRQIITPGSYIALIYNPFDPISLSRSKKFLDGSLSLQYDFGGDTMVYASASKGSKGGGFASAPNNPRLLRPDGSSTAEYDDEKAITTEAGIKIGMGRGSHLNLSIFNVDIDNYQTSLFGGTQFIVKNIDIRSRGVEVDILWRANDNLSFSANGTYADTLNKDHLPTERRVLIRAPKWSGIVDANYRADLNPNWGFSANANLEFRSKVYFRDAIVTEVPPQGGFAKANLRLAVEHRDAGIEVALIGRNLTDKRVLNYAGPLIPPNGAWQGSTEAPRTIALQISVRR